MDIKVSIDLSRFSEEELKSFVADGIISRFEFINEMNSRRDSELEKMKKSKIGRLFFDADGKPYPKE